MLIVLGLVSCYRGTAVAPAQPTPIGCNAAPLGFHGTSGYRLWPEAEWQAGQDTIPRTPEDVARRLQGHYRVLIVASEGSGAKSIAEWDLTLERTPAALDSVWRSHWLPGMPNIRFPLMGRMAYRRAGSLDEGGNFVPAPSDWKPKPESVRLRYDQVAGVLRMDGAPFDALDAGTPYSIYAVDGAGGFSGRWITGTYEVVPIPTPLGTMVEQSGGYFCAHREPPI